MPQIREYTNKEELRPNNSAAEIVARGADRTADTARAGAALVGRVAADEENADRQGAAAISGALAGTVKVGEIAYDQFVVQPELSKGAAVAAGLHQELSKEWNDLARTADPNDQTVGEKFNTERLEPALERFRSSFNTKEGQKYADGYVARFREHMFERVSADTAARAGIAAVGNANTLLNSSTSAAKADPSAVGFLLDEFKTSLSVTLDTHQGLAPAKRTEIEEKIGREGATQIVASAIQGTADTNPAKAIEMANSPEFAAYLDAKDRQTLIAYAHTQRSLAHQDKMWARQNEDYQLKKTSEANEIKAGQAIWKLGSGITVSKIFDMAEKKEILSEAAFRLVARLEGERERRRTEGERIATNPEVYKALTNEMLTTTDLNAFQVKLITARTKDKTLDEKAYNLLRENATSLQEGPLKDPIFKEQIAAAKAQITYEMPFMPGKDPKGSALYADFVQAFLPQYLKMQREGTLPPNALNVKDPKSMISEFIAPRKRSMQQMMQDRIEELRGIGAQPSAPPAAPVVPGSTAVAPKPPVKRLSTGEDAKLAPDGKYYVERGGQFYPVIEGAK